MKNIFGKSRGQVMVLYAGALAFVLVGAIAMGTDVAVMYVNWQHAQKVADAAALAGANYLNGGITYADPTTGTPYTTQSGCTGETSGTSSAEVATQVACTYAVNNGLAASTISISEPTATTIKVVAAQSGLPYYFGAALGMTTYAVAASAEAQASGTPTQCNGCDLVPLGLQCDSPCSAGSFVAGQSVSFGQKFISSTIDLPGNWGWVDLDGNGGSTLKSNLANGSTGTFSVGQVINTDTGAKTGPIKQGLDSRFAGCPTIADPCNGGNPSDIPAGDPCLVTVPVVDFAAATKAGNTNLTIEAFAEVYLEPTGPNATSATNIGGCYVNTVVGNTVVGSGPTPTAVGPLAPPVLIQ